jgi:hypothetical protein
VEGKGRGSKRGIFRVAVAAAEEGVKTKENKISFFKSIAQ